MAGKSDNPPPISHVLETILYVLNKEECENFYRDLFGIEPFFSSPRGTGFALGNTVLLLFQQGLTAEDQVDDDGRIPGHGPSEEILQLLKGSDMQPGLLLKQHYCLAVESRADVEQYEERLKAKGVQITGVMNWKRGGRSVYFSDPGGHVGEIASRGIWPTY